MARDHYIPAAVLGRFSAGSAATARDRRLFVGRAGRVFPAKAADTGVERGLYDTSQTGVWLPAGTADPESVDDMISGYEPWLADCLDLLDDGPVVSLQPWLRILVPFVAAMFVRGREWGPRFESRGIVQAVGADQDSINSARIMELNRLLAPVVAARWVVLHRMGAVPFVINNLGLMPTFDRGLSQHGFAIPIGTHSVLGIFPQSARTVATYSGGWKSIIEHRYLDATEVATFNRMMSENATEWIAGAQPSVVEDNLRFLGTNSPDARVVMERWPFDHLTRVSHDRDWFRLVSATATDAPPDELPDLQIFDPSRTANGWLPPIILTLNMTEFPTGLCQVGRSIRLTLKAPADDNVT